MKLKICTISDIHLGHKRNSTESIIASLDKNFLGHPDVSKADIIFIAGDLFDGLLAPTAPEKALIYLWFYRLAQFCAKHDIVLRILEGTPSHDWKQSEIFTTLHAITETGIDFKYVKTLSIEHFDKFGVNVLYMPDEWRHTAEETLVDVKELLKSKGLDKVDLGVFHGNFEYQLPAAISGKSAHSSDEYLNIVQGLIFIGHIHNSSRFGRIVAQGSFDRLAHNEESPKGFVVADYDTETKDNSVFFIENKDARIYNTYDVQGLELQKAMEYLTDKVKLLPSGSCVRVQANTDHPIFANMTAVIRLSPLLVWTTKPIKSDDNDQAEDKYADAVLQTYESVTLTKDNLMHILTSRSAFSAVTPDIYDRAVRHLEEVM